MKCWKVAANSQNSAAGFKIEEKAAYTFEGHDLAVVSVTANGDGTRAASSSMDGSIRIYDLTSGSTVKTINAGPAETWTISHHPTQNLVASGTHSGVVNLWDTTQGTKTVLGSAGNKFAMSVKFSPNGRYVASGTFDGGVTVFDVEEKKNVKLSGHTKAVRALAFTAGSDMLITGSDDHSINVYEIRSGEQVASLSGHKSWVLDVTASSRSEHQIVSASSDKKLKVWDLRTKECVHTFDHHSDQVWGVAFDPSSTHIASVSDDCALVISDCHEK